MFDYYIATNPALWYNEQYLVKNFESLAEANYNKKRSFGTQGEMQPTFPCIPEN